MKLIKTVITTLVFSPTAATYTKDFFCGLGITLISWFTSLVTVLIIAVFVSLIGQSLSWYNHFYVSVCLYGTAAVAKIIFIHTLAKRFYYVVSVGLFYWFLSATFKDWRQTQVGFLMSDLLDTKNYLAWLLKIDSQNHVDFLENFLFWGLQILNKWVYMAGRQSLGCWWQQGVLAWSSPSADSGSFYNHDL